jgi:radical SAM protein with 4Fe4S-binding SPASM domain
VWRKDWGEKPAKKVKPYWWPPSLIARQASSAFFVGYLTRWRKMWSWFGDFGFKCLHGAAGSKGQGCIGFPSHPVWEMTTTCNLNCIHCHCSAGKPWENELTTAQAKKLLDQLADISEFRMMAFTGGEPLVRQDLFEILAYSNSLGFTNTIATNATLIDDDVASKLKDYGVVIAAVSLDGLSAETHDMVRGVPGAFEDALKGMKALRDAGILLHINITVMDYNIDELERMIDLVDEVDAGILIVYQLVSVGRGGDIKDASLGIEKNERLIKMMVDAQRRMRAVLEPVAGPQYWSFLLDQADIRDGWKMWLAKKVFHGCSAGRGFIYIKPNGEVWPCPFIEINCGNILERTFMDIYETSDVLKQLRNRESLLKGSCGECEYKVVCGGCRGRAYLATGDLFSEDPSCFIAPPKELNRNAL